MNLNTILVNMKREPFEAAAYRPSSEQERTVEQQERNRKRLFDYQVRKSMRNLRIGKRSRTYQHHPDASWAS